LLSPGYGEQVAVGEAVLGAGSHPSFFSGFNALEKLWVAEHCPQTATPMQWTCMLWMDMAKMMLT